MRMFKNTCTQHIRFYQLSEVILQSTRVFFWLVKISGWLYPKGKRSNMINNWMTKQLKLTRRNLSDPTGSGKRREAGLKVTWSDDLSASCHPGRTEVDSLELRAQHPFIKVRGDISAATASPTSGIGATRKRVPLETFPLVPLSWTTSIHVVTVFLIDV